MTAMTHRYRARVSYDGTDFRGFQLQGGEDTLGSASASAAVSNPKKRTVQLVLESALTQRLQPQEQRPIRVVAAGRTDAGVHARGQAVHFDFSSAKGGGDEPLSDEELAKVEYSLNRMLPADVRIFLLQRAPPPFYKTVKGVSQLVKWNAMMDCTGKLYSYRINLHPHSMDPIDRFTRWHPDHPEQIDVNRLGRVVQLFEGRHNFRAFAGQVEQLERSIGAKVDTTRVVYSATLVEEGNHNYRFDFHLEGALYKQVRNMVGAAIHVCRQSRKSTSTRLDEERLRFLLRQGDDEVTRRDNPSKPAPPQGLVLEQVYFDEDDEGGDGTQRF
jgi:tRNA pseudouridine38-40 synthase